MTSIQFMVTAVLTLLITVTGPTSATTLLVPGSLDAEGYHAEEGAQLDYEIRYLTGSMSITDEIATLNIEQTLHISGQAETMSAIIPLPMNTDPASVIAKQLGRDAESKMDIRVLSKEDAASLYEDIARQTRSHELIPFSGRPAAVISALPYTTKLQFTLQLQCASRAEHGMRVIECPLAAATFTGKPIQRLVFNADLQHAKPIRAIFSPTHNMEIHRDSPQHARLSIAEDKFSPSEDIRFYYALDDDPLGLRLITHREAGEKEGYFMLIGNPTGGAKETDAVPKDMIFVLDTSGSMRGDKMEQSRSAIEYCLGRLSPQDRFNIVAFGTDVKRFKTGPIAATKAARRDADAFLDDLIAVGRTNIGDALKLGLQGETQTGRVRIMLFMTDGAPTAGELVPDAIVKQIPEWNTSDTHVYAMGVGTDVDAHLLDSLAECTDGHSTYISADEEIDAKVASLYNRLSTPVLGHVQVAFGELNPNAIYPKQIHTLFRNEDFVLMGRYRDGGKHSVTISGDLAGTPHAFTYPFDFPTEAQPQHDYVATLWASRKIGYLLQELRLHGENEELITEIVALSKEYGIATEFTSFIADAGGEVNAETAAQEVRKISASARRQRGGSWAVAQAKNDGYLQGKMNAAAQSNTYEDRMGEAQTLDKLKQVGRTCYYRNDAGQWVEQGQNEKDVKKARVISRFSKEFFELSRRDSRFARAQAIGDEVVVEVGNELLTVK